MNFANQQNNVRDNQTNTNTRSYQFMNKNGFDPSTLQVGFWNEMLSLKMNPALEPSKQTETKIYDYDKSVFTSLTMEKIMILLYGITTQVIPAIHAEENKSVGIKVAGDTLVVVGTGKHITGEIRPFLAIHKSLNPDTKKPEMSIYYEFKTVDTIDDYDEKTGSYTLNKGIQSELLLFVELLKSAIVGMSNAGTHSARTVNRWRNDKIDGALSSIAEKIGVQSPFNGNNNRGGGFTRRNNVSFDSNTSDASQGTNSSDMADMAELSNIEDINNFLD